MSAWIDKSKLAGKTWAE